MRGSRKGSVSPGGVVALGLILLASSSLSRAPAADADRGVLAGNGDKLVAEIATADDVDAFTLELAAGGQLRADAKGASDLLPTLRLFDPEGAERSLTGLIKREGTSKPLLKKFLVPEGGTGVWTLTVDGGGAGTGSYAAGFKVKTPTKYKAKKIAVPAGQTQVVEVAGRTGAFASFVVKSKGDAPLSDVRIVGPGGKLEFDIADFTPKGTGLLLKKVQLSDGFGAYRVELVGPAAGSALVDVSVKVKSPRVAKRRLTLAPEATFEAATPAAVSQEGTGVAVGLTGTDFVSGSRAEIAGDGVTIVDFFVGGATAATLIVDVAADAPYGPRGLTVIPPRLEGEPVTFTGVFVVEAPPPQVLSAAPASVLQAGGATIVDVTGSGFRDGGALAISGSGLIVGSTTLLSDTIARVTVTAATDATLGGRDITWTQPVEGGGASATGIGVLDVHAPNPTVASVSPTFLRQGDSSQTLTVTGTGFRDGGALSFAGSGLTVGSTTFVDETTATVDVSAASGATLGDREVTFTHGTLGGGASGSATSVFGIRPPLATLTSISPAVLRQGDTSQSVTLTGTSFRSGGTVTISGVGVSAANPTLVSATSFEVDVTVTSGATLGLLDVTYAQPAIGGAEQVTSIDALRIDAPVPTVTAASPTFLHQGDVSQTVTFTGTGFRTGGTLSIAGTGLTVGSTTVLSDTSASVSVSVASDATVGGRDATFTQAAGLGGAAGGRTSVLAIRNPTPTVSAISPTSMTQGDTGTTITVTGTGFRSGGAVTIGASGLTLSNQSFVSTTSFQVTVDAASDATLGAADVTYTQPVAGGGDAATLSSALQIDAPTPSVTSVSPATIAQGDSAVTITVTGTNFRDGGAISLPVGLSQAEAGLTLGATTVVSDTQATVSVTAASNAVVGPRDVTFTQPAAGGGADDTLVGGLDVEYPNPTITSVTPTVTNRSQSGTFTLTGTGFRSGGQVTTNGGGVNLSSSSYVSDTGFTVAFSMDSDASLGTADLTYTQPDFPGGGASVTLTDAYEIFSQAPTLTSMEPDRILPGTSRVPVVITGTNYNSGTAVSLSGTGVTVHSTTVDSATQLTLEISAASNASVGARNVTITPGTGPAAAFTNAFRVIPADPTVTAFSHETLAQGASSIAVTVDGTNFRSGATLSASGSGVTFSSVTVSSAARITATAAVTAGATTGLRSITVAHGTADGGGSGALADAFRIIPATPTVTAANPSLVAVTGSGGPTRVVPVTITGTNFMTGAGVAISRSGGSGVSVVSGSVEVHSSTSLSCDLSITGAATTGQWNVVVSNPGSLGNSGSTGNSKVDVKTASTLTVNRVFSFDPSPHGGERVTIHGGGFSAGDVVDFGSQRGYLCQVIDQNTIVVTVPTPATASTTAATSVNVTVTDTGASAASLTGGYTYPVDDVQLVTQTVFPAQGTTSVPQSLRSACMRLTAPMNPSTATYGTSTTAITWFESGGFTVSGGARAFGPQNRWLVFTRSTTSALSTTNGGTHVLSIPSAVQSISGNSFVPTRVSSTTLDQYTFTVTTSSDTTAPTVTRTPAASATGVSTTPSVKLVFNEEIDPQYVRASNLTLKQGTTTIATVVEIEDDLRTVWLHPETELAHSTTYTVNVTASIRDLHGNAFSAASSTFTTGSSTDTTNPSIDGVVIEDLPAGLDGSTTYVSGNDTNAQGQLLTAGSTQSFDLLLPQTGFELVVTFSDDGGAGIDPSTFSAKCSAAVGSSSANAELASNFDVTSTRASWRLGASDTITAGDNVTFTFTIQDQSSNAATNSVITVDVLALTTSTSGNRGGDLDPFNARDSWVLRTDIDGYTPTFATTTGPSQRGATTSRVSDNVPDFAQALELIGLNSNSPTSAAQSTTNGNDTGTNAIMRRLVAERIRAVTRERFEIEEDGTRDADSVDIEFLLPGEQGALTSLPTYATAPSGAASTAHNEMSLGATDGADSNAYSTSGTLGRATIDGRNARKQHNINTGSSSSPTGIHVMGMFKLNVNNDSSSDPFRSTISTKFVTIHGGTPVGEHASDDNVLDGSFDRTTSSNTTHNARYDAIMDGIETVALYVSSVLAHETGHSLGLAPDSPPKTGLFGWAHRSNTFTEATTSLPNTSGHLNFGSPRNIMAPAVSLSAAVRTGTEFMRFNPLFVAHLRRRVIYDEGR